MAGVERFTLRAVAYLVIERDGKVLLGRRRGTSYHDGDYSLPSGHLDGDEPASAAAMRECLEEIGVSLTPDQLEPAHVMHRISSNDAEYVDFYFRVKAFEGEPRIMEPDKCDDLSWAPYDDLPSNTIPEVRQVLEFIQKGVWYSERTDL